MDKLWMKIVASTGSVGVVGYLLFTLINAIFTKEISEGIGSEMLAYVVFILCTLLGSALIVTLWKSETKKSIPSKPEPTHKDIKVTYGSNSTHNGNNNF